MRKLSLVLLLAGLRMFGQLQTDTITITATRQVTLQPDQLVLNVQVLAPETAGLDDVLAKIPGLGITSSNLTSVSSLNAGRFEWDFRLDVPFSQIATTMALLTKLAQQSSQTVTFYAQGTQVSQALQQSQPCSQANLISDAQKQAASLAAAAGFSVGPVLAVSDGSFSPVGSSAIFEAVGAFAVAGFLTIAPGIAPAPPTTCTAVVKFQLYRYH